MRQTWMKISDLLTSQKEKKRTKYSRRVLFNSQITFAYKIMPHRSATVSPTATVVSAYLNLCGIRTIFGKKKWSKCAILASCQQSHWTTDIFFKKNLDNLISHWNPYHSYIVPVLTQPWFCTFFKLQFFLLLFLL